LGTNQGQTSTYVNPARSGKISFSSPQGFYQLNAKSYKHCRPIEGGAENNDVYCALDRPPNNMTTCTKSGNTDKYFLLDLNDYKIKVNKYTLACNFEPESYISNWDFLGSNDALKWDLIKAHRGENVVDYNKAASWDVDCEEYYRYFKFESADEKQLLLSGIELYGTIL